MKNNLLSDTENYYFYKFNIEELNCLYKSLKNLLIEYRYNLNLNKELTFGVEIEYEGLYRGKTEKFLNKNLKNWESKIDNSLYFGGEITSPIMNDDKKFWLELKTICEFLNHYQVKVRNNAGGHVHIGANLLKNNVSLWIMFLKLYVCYEHILYRFGYGECINERKLLSTYSKFLGKELIENLNVFNNAQQLKDLQLLLDEEKPKCGGINFKHINFDNRYCDRINTIEFRFPNGTKNEIIWQNNINVFSKMIMAIVDEKINQEFLDYKLKNVKNRIISSEKLSHMVCLEDALEFADLIFDNNLDKMYFLKQYFKDFDYVTNKRHSVLSKKMTLNKK